MIFKRANHSIEQMENFLNAVDQNMLLFKEGFKYYRYNDIEWINANPGIINKVSTN